MSHIINKSGAETDLFTNLAQRGIHRFSSINDLFAFKRSYPKEIADFQEQKATEIREEIDSLYGKIVALNNEYEHLYTEQIKLINSKINELKTKLSQSSKIKSYFLKKRLSYLESHFDKIVNTPLQELKNNIEHTIKQYTYLSSNQQEEIARRSASFIAEIKRIVSVLTELAPIIYGAIGEIEAIRILQALPNEYYVINNYQHSFHRPLYMKSENDYIYSIQLDHIVVGPTGVFVIETKYWNNKSIANNNLFSPVKQLRRGGFALFVVLNNRIRGFREFNNHWGSTQVSVSNILLMMNATTSEQFQFVKILTESTLINHITNRPVILSNEQVKCIVEQGLCEHYIDTGKWETSSTL